MTAREFLTIAALVCVILVCLALLGFWEPG